MLHFLYLLFTFRRLAAIALHMQQTLRRAVLRMSCDCKWYKTDPNISYNKYLPIQNKCEMCCWTVLLKILVLNDKLTRFPVMFCSVMCSDLLEQFYKQTCYKCQIKCGQIESGRYIFVHLHYTLSGFNLELLSSQNFINLERDSKIKSVTMLLQNINRHIHYYV